MAPNRNSAPTRHTTRIALDGDAFAVERPGAPPVRIRYADIITVAAYKVDLLTTDEIRLDICSAGGDTCTVTEEDTGFQILHAALSSRLPGYVDDWYERVVRPPFATNWIRVFHREP